jgi:hypothetical protein
MEVIKLFMNMFIRILIHKLIFRREMLDKVKTKLIYHKS